MTINFLPSRRLLAAWFVIFIAILGLPPGATLGADLDSVLDNAGVSAQVVVSTIPMADGLTFSDTEMGQRVAGVLVNLDGDQLDALRACLQDLNVEIPDGTMETLAFLHVKVNDVVTSYKVAAIDDARAIVCDISPGYATSGLIIDRHCFEDLYADVNLFRGPFKIIDRSMVLGLDLEIPKPYVASPYMLDEELIRERLHPTAKERLESYSKDSALSRSMKGFYATHVTPATRILNDETFKVRLPAGYDGRHPAGLLVWCRGGRGAGTPRMFSKALDEMGFICVSAAFTHNGRHATDRKQIMLDLVATAASRYHIDPRRVYVSGISGGGKISSTLLLGFPEVFYGAVPIVGLASYNKLRGMIPQIEKPVGKQLALARLRPMVNLTGENDFNYREIIDRVERLNLDRFERVYYINCVEMGHEMPTAAYFAEALAKVDEIYQEIRSVEREAASDALDACLAGLSEGATLTAEVRRQLAEVMRLGPWTDAAWQAADLLR